MSDIVLLTPTGDRVDQLRTVIECIKNQAILPTEWIIVDDGLHPFPDEYLSCFTFKINHIVLPHTDKNTVARNFVELLNNVNDKTAYCVMIEDDDYYPPAYLEFIKGVLDNKPYVGSLYRKYFRLSDNQIRIFKNSSFGCLHSTAFRASEIPVIKPIIEKDINNYSVDVNIWKKWNTPNNVIDYGKNTPVGFKSWLLGRTGATPANDIMGGYHFHPDIDNEITTLIKPDIVNKYKHIVYNIYNRKDCVDVVIPLSNESRSNNDELRIALRSVEKYVKNLGIIWVLGEKVPEWLTNVKVLAIPDRFKHNKDANLFTKLLYAARCPLLSENFIFLSDDQLFLKDFDAKTSKTVFNRRGKDRFNTTSTWHSRMRFTFEYLEKRGINLSCNFDAHVPVVYNKRIFASIVEKVPFTNKLGFCINTLVCGLEGRNPDIDQEDVKVTLESPMTDIIFGDKLFCGYNDKGFNSALKQKLRELFPLKSKYEK